METECDANLAKQNGIMTRNSLRLVKHRQLTSVESIQPSNIPAEKTDDAKELSSGECGSQDEAADKSAEDILLARPPQKRQWQEWSKEEKDEFFHAVVDYGKDFEKILLHLRKKIKGDESKSKDQIRHLYYRTWNTIQKYLGLPSEPDPRKALTREIHYVVCYGQLRRKGGICTFGPKAMSQLDQLVTTGSTVVRVRGKNIRIRPPHKAMRRLYPVSDQQVDLALPKRFIIELLPYSMQSFNYVQNRAFNPRLRLCNVSPQAKLSQVFEMLTKRYVDVQTTGESGLELVLYPFSADAANGQPFSVQLERAAELMKVFEKKPEIQTCLDQPTLLSDSVAGTLGGATPSLSLADALDPPEAGEFPRIFGAEVTHNWESDEDKPRRCNVRQGEFPGYWTNDSARDISISVVCLAMGKPEVLKFKYDWRAGERSRQSTSKESLSYLSGLCKCEIRRLTSPSAQSSLNLDKESHCPPSHGSSLESSNGVSKIGEFAVPYRPRLRSKKPSLTLQQCVPRNRLILPRQMGQYKDKISSSPVYRQVLPCAPGSVSGNATMVIPGSSISGPTFIVDGSMSPLLLSSPDPASSAFLQSVLSPQAAGLGRTQPFVLSGAVRESMSKGTVTVSPQALNALLQSGQANVVISNQLSQQLGDQVNSSVVSLDELSLPDLEAIIAANNQLLLASKPPPGEGLLLSSPSARSTYAMQPVSMVVSTLNPALSAAKSCLLTPSKEAVSNSRDCPSSPDLGWLENESVDMSLSGFLNTCQALAVSSASDVHLPSFEHLDRSAFNEAGPAILPSVFVAADKNEIMAEERFGAKRRIIMTSLDPALPQFPAGESMSGFELSFQLGSSSSEGMPT